jgi:hypothetical protein
MLRLLFHRPLLNKGLHLKATLKSGIAERGAEELVSRKISRAAMSIPHLILQFFVQSSPEPVCGRFGMANTNSSST